MHTRREHAGSISTLEKGSSLSHVRARDKRPSLHQRETSRLLDGQTLCPKARRRQRLRGADSQTPRRVVMYL